MEGLTARRIGDELRQAMDLQGITVRRLAELTGKGTDHVEAVIHGYPNSKQRPTQLDTVDEIATVLGLKLDLAVIDRRASAGSDAARRPLKGG